MSEDKKACKVYVGVTSRGKIVYVGTTTQEDPRKRFYKHRANGKRCKFKVIKECPTVEEMLQEEFRLIKEHSPKHNKRVNVPQNHNRRLTPEELQSRVGQSEWCQVCLKRHIRAGRKTCSHCPTPKEVYHELTSTP